MATVYEARDPAGRTVALKILHPGRVDPDDVHRLRREFEALQVLEHPGVVRVYDVGIFGEQPWFTMEYVDGSDLESLLRSWSVATPPDRFERVERILRGLCEALVHVHEHGLIHRDLKPSNVLITPAGAPKLTDFGGVKAVGGTEHTEPGRLIGTAAFMAPEQITGDVLDARADLYSLGAMLYILLTGRPPIEGRSIAGFLARHLTAEPALPSSIDPVVPRHLERICMRLLRKKPEQRFASARCVLAALDGTRSADLLHGRDDALGKLDAHLKRIRAGDCGVCVIIGGLGSGKSALLGALEAQARRDGFVVARCGASARVPPLTALLDQTRGRPSPGADDLSVEQIVGLLRAAIDDRPRVWLIDDLDRLRRVEMAVILGVFRARALAEGAPLLIVGTATREDGAVGALCREGSVERLTLEGLRQRDCVLLVRDRGLGGAAAQALGARLHRDLGGVPGAIIEQLDALIDAGWLRAGADGALRPARTITAMRAEPLPVPARVRAREAAILSRLTDIARLVYDGLVVLGIETNVDILATLIGRPSEAVAAALGELEGQALAQRYIEGLQELVRLRQIDKQPIHYGLIELSRRTALHRSAARVLGRRLGRRAGPLQAQLVEHHRRGGQVAQAVEMLLSLGRRWLTRGALDEARGLVDRARSDLPVAVMGLSDEDAARLRRVFFGLEAEVLHRSGDLQEALTAWRRVLAEGPGGDGSEWVRARAGRGLVLAERGRSARALPDLDAAFRVLPQREPMWTLVARSRAWCLLAEGQIEAANASWEHLLRISTRGDPTLGAAAAAGRTLIILARGELARGCAELERIERRWHVLGATRDRNRCLLWLADLALVDGRLLEAVERAQEVARAAPADSVEHLQALGLAMEAAERQGDRAEAMRLGVEGLAVLSALTDMAGTARWWVARVALARGLVALGDAAAACSVLDEPDDDCKGLRDPAGQSGALRQRLGQEGPTVTTSPLPWVRARVAIDRAVAAPEAAEQALAVCQSEGLRMLELDALDLVLRGRADERLRVRRERLCAELAPLSGDPRRFMTRWHPA